MKILEMAVLLCLVAVHVSAQVPTAIYFNGRIWTDPERPDHFVEAIAVHQQRVLQIGNNASIKALAGPATQLYDLGGRLMTPGFNDAHIHFLSGSLGLAQIDLAGASTLQEACQLITAYIQQHPDRPWYTGGGWQYSLFAGGLPHKQLLDSLMPDKPVYLSAYDGHSGWVNSKALALANITATTRFDGFGSIGRDANGEPNGVLLEGAQQLVRKMIPPASNDTRRQALLSGMQYAASLGITAIQNASGSVEEFGLYEQLLKENKLTLRSSTAFSIGRSSRPADLVNFQKISRRYAQHPMLRAPAVKLLLDGVIESHTAAMLEPYADTAILGELALPAPTYQRLVRSADSAGFQVYTHAIGDRAVREVLNAYETIIRKRGSNTLRHRVEHIETCEPADVLRFASLGVLASMEPIHADPGTVAVWEKAVGPKRLPGAFQWKNMLEKKITLVYSSDWPAAISLSPIRGIHVAVNRQTPDGYPPGGWVPAQRISVAEAMKAYTWGGAYASFREHELGKLQPGYLADMIVLDQDVFRIDPSRIHSVKVDMTIFNGRPVYQRTTTTSNNSK
ncbi:MAG: amidohydrolase [Chitinophagaceae bacterium]|nr:amidohydrolase [Chitinophagaceae bacterium]